LGLLVEKKFWRAEGPPQYQARLDLLEQFVYFGERAGIGVAASPCALCGQRCYNRNSSSFKPNNGY
jgi:hypothetical protein